MPGSIFGKFLYIWVPLIPFNLFILFIIVKMIITSKSVTVEQSDNQKYAIHYMVAKLTNISNLRQRLIINK